ncbi:Na+/H+ antiporter NhaC family protein [Desulfosporosinus sp. PR]|uniref:Na+/H+ antiporter NhaC family protein n=1 Tax=Candidatus Desulfosporosinus nitrosoreducens TaxID=3401928 RepID=UPI0027F93E1F|nr:Na+/H+ antiporter NhaC family protein [Desulfosporosinus sp. PR]MDQ7092603.1 Na+/H+ antiporter NhaC family protein [Desulfosporosinus sp. PR]
MKAENNYLLISLVLTFALLVVCTLKGIFIGFPLALCWLNFAFIAWRRGYSLREILQMSYQGGKKSLIVVRILILVGAITSLWIAAGTTPAVLYYGIRLLNPKFFLVYAFLISSAVSFLLGTSFGTVSTVGLALILMAKSGHLNSNMAAGAIIAGAYFGDRCSPMSSSANLVANLTTSNLYENIKGMFRTGTLPFFLSALAYLGLSLNHPLTFAGNTMLTEISRLFSLNWLVFSPALVILILAFLKVDVKKSMLVSILLAGFISMEMQRRNLLAVLQIALLGFKLQVDSPLKTILQGGGILSMWKVTLVVFVSCCLAGLFAESNILKDFDQFLAKAKSRSNKFLTTTIMSLLTSILGCSQTISIVLTHSLMDKVYTEGRPAKTQLALDLENTAVPLAALIPWNAAGFVPTSTLNVSLMGFIPFAFFLYLLPLLQILSIYIANLRTSPLYQYRKNI